MRKHLSVFMLYNRLLLYKVLAVLAGSAVLQLAAYKASYGILADRLDAHQPWVLPCLLIFLAAYVAVVLICVGDTRSGSQFGYTLQRLRISENSVLLHHCAAASLAFLLLWMSQILICFGLAMLDRQSGLGAGGPQGMMMDLYRTQFLHSVIPLEDHWTLGRNLFYCLGAGISCAAASLMLRHGEKTYGSLISLLLIQSSFVQSYSSAMERSVFFGIAVMICAGLSLMYASFEAHTGKKASGYED